MPETAPEAYSYPLLIKHLIEYGVARAPKKEIVYRDLVRYTWHDFYHDRLRRLARALADLGVKPGMKVGVLDLDTHRYLELFFAVPMMGAVLHTINLRLPPEWILHTIRHAEDDVLVVRDELVPLLEKVKDKLPPSVKLFIIGSDKGEMPSTTLEPAYEYEELLRSAKPDYEFPDLSEDTWATLFYTTGTTGLPKGVWFTHRQIVLHTLSVAIQLASFPADVQVTSTDVLMPMVPFFHVHSWGMPFLAGMLGQKVVLLGRYRPEVIFELMRKEGVTFSHMVPTLLHMMVYHPKAEEYRDALSRWKVVIGGAALPRGLAKKARELGIKVMAGYGLSETCPVLTIAVLKDHMLDWPEEERLDVAIKTGFPIPLVKLRVVDEEMRDVPRDEKSIGEIVVRAPWLTQSYYKDPERSKELWRGGWLHTGDMAVWDEEGYVMITGRYKFMIKSGGEWIPPLKLEDILSTHEAVSEVAVIPVPSSRWGERPIALVVLKPEFRGRVSEEDLRKHMEKAVEEGKIVRWWIPDRFVFVDSLPKTSVGKTDYLKLIEQYKTMQLP